MSSLYSVACPYCHAKGGQGGPTRTPEGDVTCTNCSRVLDESNLVSEVTFAETSSGAAMVNGKYVSGDRATIGGGGNRMNGMSAPGESQAQTVEKTRRRILSIAAVLNIAEHVSSEAVHFFKLALGQNFVKGRKSQHVVSACLYLACRMNKTQHMLMDFAEVICVNVFAIGATYLQLIRCICIKNVPLTDPTIYIRRFTMSLEFGDLERQVREDAVRVVHRMGKDWLVRGRRPAGVAAAAVIIAARMNNFRRSKLEIVQLAKIAEETIQRRLDEFRSTKSSTLTVKDFRVTNLETENDPPSYKKHRDLEKKLGELKEKYGEDAPEDLLLNEELIEMSEEIRILEEKRKLEMEEQRKKELEKSELGIDVTETLDDPEFQRAAEEVEKGGVKFPVAKDGTDEDQNVDIDDDNEKKSDDGENTDAKSDDESLDADEEKVAEKNALLERGIGFDNSGFHQDTYARYDAEGSDTFDRVKHAEDFLRKFRGEKEKEREMRRNALASLQSDPKFEAKWESKVSDDPHTLADVDDDEIESLILTPSEVKLKEQVWMSLNAEYLIEEEKRKQKRKAEIAAGTYRPKKRNRKKPQAPVETSEVPPEDATAESKAVQMVNAKKFTKKLNYNAIGTLFH